MGKYISPCSVATEKIATGLDDAIIAKDSVVINERINEALALAESEDAVSKATIYYCLGTAYGALDSIGGTNNEESLKKQIYFFRKSIALLEGCNYLEWLFPLTQSLFSTGCLTRLNRNTSLRGISIMPHSKRQVDRIMPTKIPIS